MEITLERKILNRTLDYLKGQREQMERELIQLQAKIEQINTDIAAINTIKTDEEKRAAK